MFKIPYEFDLSLKRFSFLKRTLMLEMVIRIQRYAFRSRKLVPNDKKIVRLFLPKNLSRLKGFQEVHLSCIDPVEVFTC